MSADIVETFDWVERFSRMAYHKNRPRVTRFITPYPATEATRVFLALFSDEHRDWFQNWRPGWPGEIYRRAAC